MPKIIIILLFLINSIAFSQIKMGIDVLQERDFDVISNKKIALLSNFAGRNSKGVLTAEILANSDKFNLNAILAPEHGFYTTVPAGLSVEDNQIFNIPIKSLYGSKKEPNTEFISSLDAVVVDLQDIGVRSYTYLSTLFNTMYVCALSNTPIIILDRPNPLGGLIVDGNVLDTAFKSFVGIIPIPYIHGCTFGELAYLINEELLLPNHEGINLKCDLTIITMKKWERWMQWEDTKLNWYPTSPHIPTIAAVRGIATLGIFGELGFISIGIGTTLPFQYIGSTSFDIKQINELQNSLNYSGLQLSSIFYRPFYGMYSGTDVPGMHLTFIPENSFSPYSDGLEIMYFIKQKYPNLFDISKFSEKSINMFYKVTGGKFIYEALFINNDLNEIRKISKLGVVEFIKKREKYLLY